MAIWAIADTHLSFGIPNKSMDVFGEQWVRHFETIATHWNQLIQSDDLVLLAGDISWARKLEDAVPDLEWIDQLPGTKVLIRGNHESWWPSKKKLEETLPPSLHAIHNDSFVWNNIAIAGARLWDNVSFNFDPYIDYRENPYEKKQNKTKEEIERSNQKIYQREIEKLKLSLDTLPDTSKHRIAMTHYPPLSAELQSSEATDLLEEYNINLCVFGHLHNVYPNALPFGEKNGIHYRLTSCDYLDFKPLKVDDLLTSSR